MVNSKMSELKAAYFEFIFVGLLDFLPYFCGFLILNYFIGSYIGGLLLRPFTLIASYCEAELNGEKGNYNQDFFSDLKILTTFSDYFFNTLQSAKLNGTLKKIAVPDKYTRIHKPVFEYGFFLQYLSLILISSICAAFALFFITTNMHAKIVQLSIETLSVGADKNYFFMQQKEILETLVLIVLAFHVVLYVILAFNLYSKVSTPAFAIFATMRSFLKGSYSNRVHLLGYNFIKATMQNNK